MHLTKWYRYDTNYQKQFIKRLQEFQTKNSKQEELLKIYIAELSVPNKAYYQRGNEKLHPLLKHWKDIMDKGFPFSANFQEDEFVILVFILGKDMAMQFLQMLDLLAFYPYPIKNSPNSLRNNSGVFHVETALDLFDEYLLCANAQISINDYLLSRYGMLNLSNLSKSDNILQKTFILYPVIYALEHGDIKLRETLKNIVLDIITQEHTESNLNFLGELLQIIIHWNDREAVELLQDIFSKIQNSDSTKLFWMTINQGTVANLQKMLEFIVNTNLDITLELKEALATWTNIIPVSEAPRYINRQFFDLLVQYFQNPNIRQEAIHGNEPVSLYLALWVEGCYHCDVHSTIIEGLIKEGTHLQRCVVLYFLDKANFQEFIMVERIKFIGKAQFTNNDGQLISILLHHNLALLEKIGDISTISREELINYYSRLKLLVQTIPKNRTYNQFMFPWNSEELNLNKIVMELGDVARYLQDQAILDDYCSLINRIDGYKRREYYLALYKNPQTPTQLELLINTFLFDDNESLANTIYKLLSKMKLENNILERIVHKGLVLPDEQRRSMVEQLLLVQPDEFISKLINSLLSTDDYQAQISGLQLLYKLKLDFTRTQLYESLRPLLDSLNSNEHIEKLLALFHQEEIVEPEVTGPLITDNLQYNANYIATNILDMPLRPQYSIEDIFPMEISEVLDIVDRLQNLYKENLHLSYESSGQEYSLKDGFNICNLHAPRRIDRFPYPKLWLEFFEEYIGNEQRLYQITLTYCLYRSNSQFINMYEILCKRPQSIFGKLKAVFSSAKNPQAKWTNYAYGDSIGKILANLYEAKVSPAYRLQAAIFLGIKHLEKLSQEQIIQGSTCLLLENGSGEVVGERFILRPLLQDINSDEEFITAFALVYKLNHQYSGKLPIPIYNFIRAYYLDLIPKDEIFIEIFQRQYQQLPLKINALAALSKHAYINIYRDYSSKNSAIVPELVQISLEIAQQATLHLVDLTFARTASSVTGLTPAQAVSFLNELNPLYGSSILALIITKIIKVSTGKPTRIDWNTLPFDAEIISKIQLDNDISKIQELIDQGSVSRVQIFTILFTYPQFLPQLSALTSWEHFIPAYYFLQAHFRYTALPQKDFIKYTTLDLENFAIGAFDWQWYRSLDTSSERHLFHEMIQAINSLCDATVNNHFQRLYDAVCNEYEAEEIIGKLQHKRSRELLFMYSLIPLSKSGKLTKGAYKEALIRYKYIRQFMLEAKEFGQQRRASDTAAGDIAIDNLARNLQYDITSEFIMTMEAMLYPAYIEYFEWNSCADSYMRLVCTQGKLEIECRRAVRILKSIPQSLRKEEYYQELKQHRKIAQYLYDLAKNFLEDSMNQGHELHYADWKLWSKHPVMEPILNSLVVSIGDELGFINHGKWQALSDNLPPLTKDTVIKIATNWQLATCGLLNTAKRHLDGLQLIQPFAQI